MEDQKQQININAADGTQELIIRHGEALAMDPQRKIQFSGCIESVYEWMNKRSNNFEEDFSAVIFDIDVGAIQFIEDTNDNLCHEITGKVEINPELKKFRINTGEYENHEKLANRLRLLGHHFQDRDKFLDMISKLKSFEAKVNQQINAKNDDRGNIKQLRNQIAKTNIPKDFEILIPLVKGGDLEYLKVELLLDDSLGITLFCWELNEKIEKIKLDAIKRELESIRSSFPGVPVLQK